VRGTGPDGTLVAFGDPDLSRPQDSDIEASIEAGLSVIDAKINDKQKLRTLFAQQSIPLELPEIVGSIKYDSYADLKGTTSWRDSYELSNIDLLALPGMEEMQVRVLGPETSIRNDVVDTLLSLALFNIELYLSENFQCASSSTGSPLGDSIDLKIDRLTNQSVRSENMWSLLEINDVPDLGKFDISERRYFEQLLKITTSSHASEFRKWFHERKSLDEKEVFKEYLKIQREVPGVQRLPTKVLRFVICTALGVVSPVLGTGASALDTFVVEKLFKGRSPKFFIDDLRDFRGRIQLQSSSGTKAL